MHIVYLTSWYPLNKDDINGCFFREQAHALAKAGNKVGVIAPQFRSLRLGKNAVFGSYRHEIWQDDQITTYIQHDVFWFPKVPYLNLNRWVKSCVASFDAYIKKEGKPDIIQVQSMTYAGLAALEIYKKYKVPYCIMEHSSTFARGLVPQWHFDVLKEVVEKSNYNMAVSQDLTNLLEIKFIGSQWHYFPNILDALFNEKDNSIKVVDKQFCAVANLNPNKGIDLLVQAFANVYKGDPECTLIIAGEGSERQNLQQLAASLGVSQAVQFLGSITRQQVKDLMAASFCYMLSSHIETFGVVVIEALSQGTPVISTRCGGPESILTPEDGVFVSVDHVEEMAQAMVTMLKLPQKYDRADIRRRCLEKYAEPKFIKNMTHVYERCIGEISDA